MIKKISLGVLFVPWILVTFFHVQVFAKDLNVTDCFKNQSECNELSDTNVIDADKQKETEAVDGGGESLFLQLVKTVLALALILGLIYILLKLLNKKNRLIRQVNALENLGGISVGQGKSLQIIRVGSRLYLIGVGENVELLHEITDEGLIKEMLEGKEEGSQSSTTSIFPAVFAQRDREDRKPNFKNMFASELNKLKKSREQIIKQHTEKEDSNE